MLKTAAVSVVSASALHEDYAGVVAALSIDSSVDLIGSALG
jgi:hypothetical protein